MGKKILLEEFKEKYYKKFPNSDIEILEFTNRINSRNEKVFIKIKNKYGICELNRQELLYGNKGTIQSAINKEEYFINQIKDSCPQNLEHYKIVKYIDSKNIIVQTKYGLCKVFSSVLLYGNLPSTESAINKTEYFINKLKEVHGNRYDYSLVEYTTNHFNIKIICKEHGEFEQAAYSHLATHGCRGCKEKDSAIRHKENPTGWSYSNWEKAGLRSKNFDAYKIYILECWDEEERFYKIGKTFYKIEKRFFSKRSMPYKWSLIKTFVSTCTEISKLEKQLQQQNKEHKYVPSKNFNGRYECFSQIKY